MNAGRFKPYPEYKDSGVEWLGEIPAHWEVKRTKCRAYGERTHSRQEGGVLLAGRKYPLGVAC